MAQQTNVHQTVTQDQDSNKAMANPHILIVSYPAPGHLNPSLQFAERLIRMGAKVTVATSKFAQPLITKSSCTASQNFNFAPISDGYQDDFKPQGFDVKHINALRDSGPGTIEEVIGKSSQEKWPVTCVVYTILLTWAARVARANDIPPALLWIQPAMVLGIYHNYFNGYEDEIKNRSHEPNWSIQWPGLPLLTRSDLPSFILPSTTEATNVALEMFREQFKTLDEVKDSIVLVNTFDALEPVALKCVENYKMIGIGPLIPYQNDYLEWLNSKPNKSVIYIAFGSLMTPSLEQLEEIAAALLDCNRPFLWVIRATEKQKLSCIEDLERKGKIISWSSQIEVLKHPSVGCFLTHCGWNSTLESLIFGVPVIAFPQWTDQGTNAKLLQDVWKTGVRVGRNGSDGILERNEIKKAVEVVMNDKGIGMEMRNNVEKWKELAMDAMKDDGSSINNLKEFVFKENNFKKDNEELFGAEII